MTQNVFLIAEQRLKAYQQAHLQRQRRLINHVSNGVQVHCDNRICINFCSNDYLGLAKDPRVIKALQQGAEHYGVGSGASQLICGHYAAHRELEEAFAEFIGVEAALLFPSGYMANLGVMNALASKGDIIYQDKINHASLLDAAHLARATLQRYRHRDISHLQIRLQKQTTGQRFIATDAVFSMNGDLAPLPELIHIAKQFSACLMIDDAHGIGVLGNKGRGSIEYFDLDAHEIPIAVYPLGKAFGCSGALVAGSQLLIECLIQFARSYIYTTAPPPAIASAACKSLEIIQQEDWRRDKLNFLIQHFVQAANLRKLPLLPSLTPIQSIVIGDCAHAMIISEQLFERGFLLSAIRPPTVPPNTTRLRITLNVAHDTNQIDQLLDELSELYSKSLNKSL